jgi:cytochrome P450
MVTSSRDQLSNWSPGGEVDIFTEMGAITLRNAVKAFFGTELEEDLASVREAVKDRLNYELATPPGQAISTAAEQQRAIAGSREATGLLLGEIVHRFIDERRASAVQGTDLLANLLRAVDAGYISEQQAFDEAVTIFGVGHNTTALALTWSLYLLAQHPKIEDRFLSEIDEVLGGRDISPEALSRLAYAEKVVKEALRIYPPVWIIRKEAIEPVTLSGYKLPSGSVALISPYAVHRDPRNYSDPMVFQPDRWDPEMESRLPQGANLAFAQGPYGCIGWRYAMLQIITILATISSRYRLTLVPDQAVSLRGALSLTPRGGIRMTTELR